MNQHGGNGRKTSSGGGERLRSLDGLRGIAALVVVIHHSLLVVPSLAGAYFARRPRAGTFAWIMDYTPLHLIWAGKEAVYVFFVLSGLVLALPFLRAPATGWAGYYPRRVLRLYFPVIAAVVLGTAIAAISHRHPRNAASLWLQHRPAGPTVSGFLHDVTLVGGTSDLISPLWSLQWEVIFSLLLPAYIGVALLWPRLFWPKMVGVFAVVAVGAFASASALFLAQFAVGVLLAARLGWFADLAGRINRSRHARMIWVTVIVVALLLLISRWLEEGAGLPSRVITASPPGILLGATLLIFVAAFSTGARRMLTSPVALWLGRISFSLYLIHEPIVIAFGYAFGARYSWAVLPTALLICLPLATVFYRLVEGPAHNLSRWVGRRVEEHARAATSPG